MAVLRRLGFYLVGLSLGVVFLAFILKNKSQDGGFEICYFPNCRTLKDMRSKPMVYSESVQAQIAKQELDSTRIAQFLYDGDIDFGNSETKTSPCKRYRIEKSSDKARLTVKNCPDSLVVEQYEP